MDYEIIKQEIQQAYNNVKASSGFRERVAQKHMIGLIAREFGHSSENYQPVCVIEAGTGTGKTYGYSLPLIPIAKQANKKIVIATATVALQEQLYKTDLPQLKRISGLDFTFELAKGRRRYMCPLKVQNIVNTPASLFENSLLEKVKSLVYEFDHGWDGDFDSLSYGLDDSIKSACSVDSSGCIKSNCPFFKNCPFFEARKNLDAADVIVANHALLISDFNLNPKGGIILPSASETFYVIDEGHHLPHEVVAHTASMHAVNGSVSWVENVIKMSHRIGSVGDETFLTYIGNNHIDTELNQLAESLKEELKLLYATMASMDDLKVSTDDKFKRADEPTITRFPHGKIPDWLRNAGQNILSLSNGAYNCVAKIIDQVNESISRKLDDELVSVISDLGFLRERLDNMQMTWRLMLEDKESKPHAKWITYVIKNNTIDFIVNASPTEAATFLNSTIFQHGAGTVITSATLTALNSFDHYFREVGLCYDDTKQLKLPSPFDFANAGKLYVPASFASPTDADDHTQAMINWILSNVNGDEGTLMLFSSSKQMKTVADAVRTKFNILVQGENQKHELIKQHKSAIDSGKGSVLIGLDSFGEGLNLPGKYLTHVLIAKIPFPVPSSPVEKAQSEYIESTGGNSFMEVSVPVASKKLTQWVGRLLRTEDDYGRVTILDVRLKQKRYGKDLLNALPPFALV